MKKLLTLMLVLFNTISIYSTSLDFTSRKSNFCHSKSDVIEVMKKYHKKYGSGEINYDATYGTIKYWARYYDIDFMFALSIFAIESGFTYECKSHFNAIGMGQITNSAVKDFNDWYGKNENFADLKLKNHYDRNIMVAIGYIRMCWDRYKVIENGNDLIKSYNVGIGNLKKIKNNEYDEDNKWVVSSNRYIEKFIEAYDDFTDCRR